MRPPYSKSENLFIDLCTRCDDCIRACAPRILVRGDGGFPTIDFHRGPCTFCGDCAHACQNGAFVADRTGPAWSIVANATTACLERKGITCRLCQNWCAEDAIRFRPMTGGRSEVTIDRARCTGCGACVESCPADAIAMVEPVEERVPA